MEFLKINNLCFTYPGREVPALEGIDLTVKKGEFITVCGRSGCGKSTLLRLLVPSLRGGGIVSGEILFDGTDITALSKRDECTRIGFAMQSPDDQLVCDKVWHELAFGLESLGLPTAEIRRRVAETAEYFGIADKFDSNVNELSGGQKQLVSLAAVMVMRPELLILDEPTAQLDPIAASEHIAAIRRLNRELGVTVILAEHRLEDAFEASDRVIVMDSGRVAADASPDLLGTALPDGFDGFMPAASRVWRALTDRSGDMPISVRDGRKWLTEFVVGHSITNAFPEKSPEGETVLEAKELHYRYRGESHEAVRGLSLSLHKGEIYCILGGNGSGKSTALSLLAGLLEPGSGDIRKKGRISLLPQDPCLLFCKSTVREELSEIDSNYEDTAHLCGIGHLADAHPYDLSGGERQRVALAKILLCDPDIILADEPTKGMDREFKLRFTDILRELSDKGKSIIIVSHDAEFCAETADRCGLFFDGAIVSEALPREFFTSASYYTTAVARMSRGIADSVTTDELIVRLGGTVSHNNRCICGQSAHPVRTLREKPLPLWRRISAALCAVIAVILALFAVTLTDITSVAAGTYSGGNVPWHLYASVLGALILCALMLYRKSKTKIPGREKRRLTPFSVVSVLVLVIVVPLSVYFGWLYFGARRYYFISLLVAAETLLAFVLMFERGKPKAREIALIAVLCAIGTAGRAVMFMLPECKPVVAVTVIAGAVLGSSKGFTVGAVTMLVSNLLFGSGPWTPWQMLAMGAVGLIAGLVFSLTRPTRAKLCLFGAFAAIFIYGGIMNPAALIMWAEEPAFSMVIAYYVTGFPIDLIRGVSTAVFLWFAAEPMTEKLYRVREKFGL